MFKFNGKVFCFCYIKCFSRYFANKMTEIKFLERKYSTLTIDKDFFMVTLKI